MRAHALLALSGGVHCFNAARMIRKRGCIARFKRILDLAHQLSQSAVTQLALMRRFANSKTTLVQTRLLASGITR